MIIFLESYKPGDFSELALGTSPSRSRGTVNKHLGSLLLLMESPAPPQAYYGLQNFQSLEGLSGHLFLGRRLSVQTGKVTRHAVMATRIPNPAQEISHKRLLEVLRVAFLVFEIGISY